MLVLDRLNLDEEQQRLANEMNKQNEIAIRETEAGLNLKLEDLMTEDNRLLHDFYTNVNLTKSNLWNNPKS